MKVCVYMTLFQLGGIDSYWRLVMTERRDIHWQVFTNTGANTPFASDLARTFYGIHWKKPWQTCREMLRYLQVERPDAIVLNGTLSEVLIAPLLPLLYLRRIKVVSVYHNSNIYHTPLKNHVNRAILSFFGWFHHTNFFVSRAVQNFWYCRGKVNRLPLTVKPRSLDNGLRDISKIRIAFIGRASWEKGPDVFESVINHLAQDYPELNNSWVAELYGDGPMLQEITSPHIKRQGWVSDMSKVMEHIDILLITSRTEGFPMTVVECLAAGIPILSFDVGGVREGLGAAADLALVPQGNLMELTKKLSLFCSDYRTHYQIYFQKLGESPKDTFHQNWNHALGYSGQLNECCQ